MYHFTDGGLRNVYLVNGYETRNTPYGKAVAIQNIEGLAKAICRSLVRKKSHLTGAEFRYLRSTLLMSQKNLGQAVGRTEQAVAMWEKSGKIPKYADIMVRVIYAAHADGNERVKNIVQSMNEADRDIYIIMQESQKTGWKGIEQTERPATPEDEDAIPA
jgi:DNA-binding transcriptional regulator YiaG